MLLFSKSFLLLITQVSTIVVELQQHLHLLLEFHSDNKWLFLTVLFPFLFPTSKSEVLTQNPIFLKPSDRRLVNKLTTFLIPALNRCLHLCGTKYTARILARGTEMTAFGYQMINPPVFSHFVTFYYNHMFSLKNVVSVVNSITGGFRLIYGNNLANNLVFFGERFC